MKIFVLSSRVPYPLEKGDKLRIYHQVKYLSKKHQVHLCCLSTEPVHSDAPKELAKICDGFTIIPLSRFRTAIHLFLALFSSIPFQVAYFFQKQAKQKILRQISAFKPDHIYVQLIRTTEYVKDLHKIPKTIDYMDSLSKGMDRRAKRSSALLKPIVRSEARRLLQYENLIFEYFDQHTIISSQDRDSIWHEKRKEITIVPNGIDRDFFQPRNSTKEYHIAFTGNMSYVPNVDSAVFLATEILPLVHEQIPEVKLLLAGATPHKRVKQLASSHVRVTGWLDDIREAYWKSKVFVAPLRLGSGLQNKLLEAMMLELPCVTSPLANNALKASPEHSILIANNAEGFAKQIIRLLQNPELSRQIGKNGHQYIAENYHWDSTTAILENLISKTNS
jgi:sugar transferase (PEP-CTERM/EpsH1 system associated)